MKSKKILVILSIISCLALFTACTAERAEELQSEESSITSSSEESSISLEEDLESEDEVLSSEPEASSDVPAPAPSSPANAPSYEQPPEEVPAPAPVPALQVVIQKASLLGAEEKTIADEAQIQQILAYTDGMFQSDYDGPPATGGETITVLVTRDGNTEKYTFMGTEVDGYELAKNSQDPDVRNTWYFAELGAYQYLADLLQG
ncbi:hypothetical protein [Anaerotruncus rubiinfantis]|uniref:hypothetical protein n=1 Tax=Anaerotruncus rubiinfantis TaxID=1720200 RepID=UPI003D7AC990